MKRLTMVVVAAFIVAGAALIERFEWIMYIFGALLVYTGYKMLTAGSEEMQPDELMAYRMFRRMVPSTDTYRDGHFFVREDGRLKATPLAAVLVVVRLIVFTTMEHGGGIVPQWSFAFVEVEAMRRVPQGQKPFEFKGGNGFMITFDISSKDAAAPAAKAE